MRGLIILAVDGDEQLHELPKTSVTIGSSPDAGLQVTGPGVRADHLHLTWDPAEASWDLSGPGFSDGTLLVNRVPAAGWKMLLTDSDRLEFAGIVLRFRRLPASPQFQGRLVTSVALRPNLLPLIFGSDLGLAPERTILLDSEDSQISPQHATIQAGESGEGLQIIDQSRTGTLLNGRNFQSERLVIGDRFRIGSYSFEYTGTAIKRVAGIAGGRIEARDVSVKVEDRRGSGWKSILSEVNLEIDQCAFVGILGGSGQGKSTLLSALCGIAPPTSGTVWIDGIPIGQGAARDARIGFVPQDDIVHQELTVSQAITLSARLRLNPGIGRAEVDELIKRTMARLGLSAFRDRRIYRLSGGQRKRVSIATELLSKPQVLYLDEPSSGLDPATEFKLMKLLRSLAATDCTVVCTTHVLGRSYLFDQLCFIQGGQLVFRGPGELALRHFEVEKLEDVYDQLDESTKDASEWRRSFESQHPELLCQGPVLRETLDLDEGVERSKPASVGFFNSTAVLLERQWKILAADHLNLFFLLTQPLLIGCLVGWVTDESVLRMFLAIVATLWFGCSNGAQQIIREIPIFRRERVSGLGLNSYLQSKYLFITALTGAQSLLLYAVIVAMAQLAWTILPQRSGQTAKERAVAAERDKERNLEFENDLISRYLGVNFADQLQTDIDAFSAAGNATSDVAVEASAPSNGRQNALIEGVTRAFASVIRRLADWWEIRDHLLDSMPKTSGKNAALLAEVFLGTIGLKVGALLAAALVGVAIGLQISAMVRNGTQAVMWVPLVLIPQILLGGFVIPRPEMSSSVRRLSEMIPSFAAQRVMDVSNVFGLCPPAMTNRTKLPIFFATGDKLNMTMMWEEGGRFYTARYTRKSPQNVSWQNLLVIPERVGRHRLQFRPGTKMEKESVEYRYDVRDYPEGATYRSLAPAAGSFGVLAAWVTLCYVGTLISLRRKESGK